MNASIDSRARPDRPPGEAPENGPDNPPEARSEARSEAGAEAHSEAGAALDWITIWQSELAAMAMDRELIEWAQLGVDAVAASAEAAATRDAGRSSGAAAAAGAAPAVDASRPAGAAPAGRSAARQGD